MSKKLAVQKATFGYGKTAVIEDLSIEFDHNKTYSIIGPSGCGKTTLLYGLAGIVKPFSGAVLVEGKNASPSREQTSIILQEYGLFPWKTVWENIALPLVLAHKETKETVAYGKELMKSLGIDTHCDHYPSQLSGGQKQRVAIARSWMMHPDILLMDEPFSSLDAMTRESLQDTVVQLVKKNEMTLVIVTHSIEEAVFMSETILVLDGIGNLYKIIDNPNYGVMTYREEESFYEKCIELRKTLKEVLDET